MSPKEVDVAIVGAGVTGLSVAWNLRQRGFRTLVVERSGIAAGAWASSQAASGSSGGRA